MIAYPFVTFPSSYIIDNKSMRLGVINYKINILSSGMKINYFFNLLIVDHFSYTNNDWRLLEDFY